jgi:predicted PurR-regulated permease PerM
MKKKNKNNASLIKKLSTGLASLKERARRIKNKPSEDLETVELPEMRVDINKMALEISPMSVFKSTLTVLMVLLATYLLYSIGNTLLLFFIAFFIASALDPLIDFLQAHRIPRAIGVLLVYIVIFVLVALFFVHLLPLIAEQLISLAGAINDFILKVSQSPTLNLPFGNQIKPYLDELYKAIDIKVVAVQLKDSLQLVSSQLLNLGGNLWSIIMQVSNGLFNFILLIILVFFMTVDEQALENFCISIFPEKYSPYITKRLQMTKVKIGDWIRGQVMVSLVAVQFSLLIAVITGICMIVPVFGRVVACVLVLPIVLNQSPGHALFIIIYYFLISQVENNIMVPLLMNKAVGLSPILIIFALLIGFQFLGVLGLILAIPIATILSIFAKDIGKRIHSRI